MAIRQVLLSSAAVAAALWAGRDIVKASRWLERPAPVAAVSDRRPLETESKIASPFRRSETAATGRFNAGFEKQKNPESPRGRQNRINSLVLLSSLTGLEYPHDQAVPSPAGAGLGYFQGKRP